MAEFTASPDVSGFTPPNQLFNYANAVGAAQGLQSNQLGIQGKQIDLANANMAQVGQAAAGLLSAYPDEASRAAAYPKVVGMLQSQGVAMNAPQTYPGEGALRMLVSQTVPVQDQYKMGMITPPGTKEVLDKVFGGGGATATPPPSAGGGGDFGTRLAQSESSGKSNVINPQGYTGTYQFGKQRLADLGYYTPAPGEDMKDNTTWAGKVSVPGFNVTDQQSFAANPAAQQAVFNTHLGNIDQAIAATPGASRFDPNGLRAVAHLGGIEGMQKFVASGGVFSPSDANGTSLAAYYNKFSGGAPGGATTAAAAPATAQPGQPVPTQVAGPSTVSTAPAAPTAAPGGPPATQQPGTTTAAAPPATTAAAPAQPTAPLATGINSPQFREAQDRLRQAYAIKAMPGYATSPQLQAAAGLLTEQAGALAKADTFQEDTQGGIHGQRSVLTNQFIPDPARRMMALADGTVINDQGKAIAKVPPQELVKDANNQYWYVPKYPTPGPGGTLAPAQPVPGQQLPTPGYVKEQEAEADRLSKMRDAVLDQAKESAQANTMISNTETALSEAQKGNLGAGALAPDRLRIVATAKALGIDLSSFGIDTGKLAAAQVTREQLQQLNGAILRKMYPQRITNADLAISGTVLPNYGLDPGALEANFGIYKKQNAYDTAKAQDMLAYEHANNGSLKGWEQQWYSKNNFATGPLDNLFGDAQEGRLASGGGGGRQAPASLITAPINPAARTTGTVYSTPKGPMKWTGTGWLPVQ